MKFDLREDGSVDVRDIYNKLLGFIILDEHGDKPVYKFVITNANNFELEDLQAIADKMEELKNKEE